MRIDRALLCALPALALVAAPASTPVIDAARHSDKATLATLIQKKADVNAQAPDGSTALHWAAYRDDSESVALLLRAGAKPNVANDLGATPLWAASQNGDAAIVRQLLAAGADPNLALLSGETPVMVAARSGYPEVVELLAAKGANLNAHGTRGQTALMWAAAQQHPAVVKVLLAHPADVRLKSDVWNEVMAVPPHGYLPYNKAIPHGGETALMFAVRVGDLESTNLLVAAGADVNDADAWGVTATSLAAHSGFTDIALFLLDKGANPNLAECGFSPLHEAVMRRDEKLVTALLEHGADPNVTLKTWTPTRRSSDDFNFEPQLVGATPYWLAARFDEPNIMGILVKHGADPKFVLHADYVAEQGFGPAPRKEVATPLMAAVGIVRSRAWVEVPAAQREALALETAKLAIELGSDLNAADTDGRTALDGAKALRFKSVVEYLTANGAKAGSGAAPPRGSRDSGRPAGPAGDSK
jgi:ankyrin repeat protein